MNSRTLFTATVLGLASVVAAPDAFAGPSAALFGGYGVPLQESGDDLFGVGYGARAGFTLLLPIYFGAAATFHSGTEGDEVDASRNHLNYYGLEVGVELELGSVGIRPYATGGLADVTSSRDAGGELYSAYLGAGVAPFWNFFDTPLLDLFVGLDARYIRLLTPLDDYGDGTPAYGLPVYLHVGASL